MSELLISNIVETELVRKSIYEKEILGWLSKRLKSLKYKEICHLALRFLFNKNITKGKDDDPIFITTESKLADKQFLDDMKYSKITDRDVDSLLKQFNQQFVKAYSILKKSKINNDKEVKLLTIPQDSEDVYMIEYRNEEYTDICELAKNNPTLKHYALALQIRYNYLQIRNHGLARDYSGSKFKNRGSDLQAPEVFFKKDDALEGFSSSFNRYFNHYCSAFPDLEKPFGSLGSFFDLDFDSITEPLIQINPPFDVTIIEMAINKVCSYLESHTNLKLTFIFTIPEWTDFPALDKLKISSFTTQIKSYKKKDESLKFIDYMNFNKIIYPCDIIEITCKNKEYVPLPLTKALPKEVGNENQEALLR